MEKLRQDDTSLLAISFFCAARTQPTPPTKWAIFPGAHPLSLLVLTFVGSLVSASAEPVRQKLKKPERKKHLSALVNILSGLLWRARDAAWKFVRKRRWRITNAPADTSIKKSGRASPLNYSSGARENRHSLSARCRESRIKPFCHLMKIFACAGGFSSSLSHFSLAIQYFQSSNQIWMWMWKCSGLWGLRTANWIGSLCEFALENMLLWMEADEVWLHID